MVNGLLVALDPGLRHCGVAVFRGGLLEYALLLKNPEKKARGPEAWKGYRRALHGEAQLARDLLDANVLVLEVPQIYKRGPGDPDDLLQLAGVDGFFCAAVNADCQVVGLRPREWKGVVPKEIHQPRILAKLNKVELSGIRDAGALTHNIYDAIGLGLFKLGR